MYTFHVYMKLNIIQPYKGMYVTIGMNLGYLILSERNQSQRNKYCFYDSDYMKYSK